MPEPGDAGRDGRLEGPAEGRCQPGPADAARAPRRFRPCGRLHPVPDDVLVREAAAGGVPTHWPAAPGADTGRVLLFLHVLTLRRLRALAAA